jgi:hypothetical protein
MKRSVGVFLFNSMETLDSGVLFWFFQRLQDYVFVMRKILLLKFLHSQAWREQL